MNIINNELKRFEDFDLEMSDVLREKVFATSECQAYLFEQKRVGRLVNRKLKKGGKLTDADIYPELEKLNRMANELATVIEKCKAELGET